MNVNIAKFLTPKANSTYLLESQTVRQGLEKFKHHGYTAIPVLTENGEFYGCVSEGDFLRHLLRTNTVDLKVHEQYKIREIMRQDFCPPLTIVAPLEDVHQQVQQQNFVPIVDDRNCFCGIVTRRDVIKYLSELAFQREPAEV